MKEPNLNILLVEDNEEHSELIKGSLSHSGKTNVIKTVPNLKEAFKILQNFKPDIIITDYNLPDGDGIEILRNGNSALFPVLVLTSNGDEEIAVEAIKAGATDYVVKSKDSFNEMSHIVQRTIREWMATRENRKIKELYSTLLKHSLQGVAVFTQGRLVYVNEQAAVYSGYTVEELLSLSTQELAETVLEEDRMFFGENMIAVEKDGLPRKFEIRSYHKKGHIIWIDMYLARIEFNGAPAVQISSVDVTDRKLAEIEIRNLNVQLEERIKSRTLELEITNSALKQEIINRERASYYLQEAFNEINDLYNNAPCGYHSLDEKGFFIKINDTELKWLGYTREEVVNKLNFADLITPQSLEKFKINYPLFKERGYVTDLEFSFVRKDGTIFPIILSATAVKDKDGKFLMSRSTAFDITELSKAREELQAARYDLEVRVEQRTLQLRKTNELLSLEINQRIAAEKTLRESEERFRKMYEDASIGIYRSSPEGRVLMANAALIHMLGYPSLEAIQSLDIETEGYEHTEERKLFIELMEEKGEIKSYESTWRKYDGGLIHVIESARAVKDSGGKTLYYEGAVEDLTARKELEESVIKAKEEAEKSDRLKSEFLAQMSHEIRTPLNSILSLISLVEEEVQGKIDEDTRTSFDLIRRGGKRLIRTVELILNMAEMQTGSYEYTPAIINIYQDILKDMIYEYKLAAKNKDISFRIAVQTDEFAICADRYSIVQIVGNLIDNAIKYTQQGSVEIGLYKDSFGRIVFQVKDTGVGISKSYAPHLFSLFSQEEQGYTRRFEGNGLGLALVKKYCEMNNAEIEYQSEKEKGSIFKVTFPLYKEETKQVNKLTNILLNKG